jgi:hypothetical protein
MNLTPTSRIVVLCMRGARGRSAACRFLRDAELAEQFAEPTTSCVRVGGSRPPPSRPLWTGAPAAPGAPAGASFVFCVVMQNTMTDRTSAQRLGREAKDAFRDAARSLGLRAVSPRRGSSSADFELIVPGRDPVAVELKAMAMPTDNRIRSLRARPRSGVTTVVVAHQVPGPMRGALDAAGVGWLDRRGHLRLVSNGVYIDSDLPPLPRSARSGGANRAPIAGRAGLAASAALLLHPVEPMGGSEISRIAGLYPSSITRALTSLVNATSPNVKVAGATERSCPSCSGRWPTCGHAIT